LYEPMDIRNKVSDLAILLSHIEMAVESVVSERYQAMEQYRHEDVGSNVPFVVAFGKFEILQDEFINAARDYRLWAYGGFISTALTWLTDQVLWFTDSTKHPGYSVKAKKWGLEVQHRREPALSSLLDMWDIDICLLQRMKSWIELRNRFIHSLGIVVDDVVRAAIEELGIEFDSDRRMMLLGETCRVLLKDIEAVGVTIAASFCTKEQIPYC
jgi:hypothetical protein